jgi:hypothetical protein
VDRHDRAGPGGQPVGGTPRHFLPRGRLAGNVYQFNAPFYGSKAGQKLPSPVVGITADGAGYLMVTRAGNVYPFHTVFYGSKAGDKLPAPVVGITAAR